MKENDQLARILKRIDELKNKLESNAELVKQLSEENKTLKEELESLKETKFEETKMIEIANMANQLKAEVPSSQSLKRKLDKYIREVDLVIEALKEME